MRVVRHRYRLPREDVNAPFLAVLSRVGQSFEQFGVVAGAPAHGRELVSSNPKFSVVLCCKSHAAPSCIQDKY